MNFFQIFAGYDNVCHTRAGRMRGNKDHSMKLFSFRQSLKVSEPYLHRNLAVYLLHRSESQQERSFLTLEEALRDGVARVHETGRVGELEIENLTRGELYVQAGDVVKGGWQDRALGQDFVVPDRSRCSRMRVRTFCVERGRWNRRAGEEATNTFKSAEHLAASRDLKLSIRRECSQKAVWSSVDAAQTKLNHVLGMDIRSAASPSSLPMSMENPVLRRRLADYLLTFNHLLTDHPDAVGFAFAINGRLNSADLYASPELFRKLWSKLLEAAAMEALAEANAPGATCSTPTAKAVSAWLRQARRGRKTRHAVTSRITLVVRENARQVSFETMDAEQSNLCVHQNILAQ